MKIRKLLRSKSGAVTVDWVIAVSAIVCLAFAVLGIANGGNTPTLADTLSSHLASDAGASPDGSDSSSNTGSGS